ncbi:membrane-bound lytic murein transglycosylase D [Aeromonas sp. RU39B]|jgi:membrane-bound lytic murein transglycosylase D|uniref:LysM peptidoglycan-binding domain-containing protein n=1 Tax=Aeromonas sp. RU39B TaxID=1907416 RepID=UPI000954E9B4|nr:LysM peptidoglycan-binding domain-containing protein [Aeromonas sp. RU39B]SIQ01105.1 membrane-bound lytic murein transglycosylase D [Aeromonas sp. RU39B]
MKVRTAILAALFLSGCQHLSNQDDRAQTAIEPVTSPQVNKKAHKRYSPRFLLNDEQLETVEGSDDLWERIGADMQLDVSDNDRITRQRASILSNDQHVATIASRAEPYLYLMVEEIERRGLPMELVAIPMIESTFDPTARSRSNAVGLWQFVPQTGRNFGLSHDRWYDGRKDVVASTSAALDYLEYLNRFFDGDWLNTMAAYNAGEGRVRNAIVRNQRRGLPTDYWSLDLPRETEQYVPKVLAMASILSSPSEFGVSLPSLANEPKLRSVDVGGQLDISTAANLAGMRSSELKALNPALVRGVTSPRGPHRLLVPVEYADAFELALADLPSSERLKSGQYQVGKGDTLSIIASRHGVSVDELKMANNLNSHALRAGQTLRIPSDGVTSGQTFSSEKVVTRSSKSAAPARYTVKNGDTLWDISRKQGVSHKDLMKWNGLSASATIKPGTKLVVSKKAAAKANSVSYQVRRGDSLSSIAARFQVAVVDVLRWNQLDKRNHLQPGQKLTLFVGDNG